MCSVSFSARTPRIAFVCPCWTPFSSRYSRSWSQGKSATPVTPRNGWNWQKWMQRMVRFIRVDSPSGHTTNPCTVYCCCCCYRDCHCFTIQWILFCSRNWRIKHFAHQCYNRPLKNCTLYLNSSVLEAPLWPSPNPRPRLASLSRQILYRLKASSDLQWSGVSSRKELCNSSLRLSASA